VAGVRVGAGAGASVGAGVEVGVGAEEFLAVSPLDGTTGFAFEGPLLLGVGVGAGVVREGAGVRVGARVDVRAAVGVGVGADESFAVTPLDGATGFALALEGALLLGVGLAFLFSAGLASPRVFLLGFCT
jgi:hypothetical protein